MADAKTEEYIQTLRTDYEKWSGQLYFIRDKFNQLVPLHLNHVQKRIGEIEREELAAHGQARVFVLKGRQGGVSTDQQARALHLTWSIPGSTALTLAHSREDTDKLFQITRRAMENFPPELLPSVGRSGTKEVTFPGLDSFFWTGTAGARRIGRGITLSRFHGSEFAFWDNPKRVISSVTPAMIPRGSVIVLETTPDAEGSEAHLFWQEAVSGANGYRAVFFPWWECDPPNYRLTLLEDDELGQLDEEEQTLLKDVHLDLEQLKWRRQKIKEMGKLEFIREYPEDPDTCWITGGTKFYDAELIWKLLRKAPLPQKVLLENSLQIFNSRSLETPLGKIDEQVIIGSDVAEGSQTAGLDSTTWTARAFPSWRLLSVFKSSRIEPQQFGSLLYEWALKEYGEALLVIEKNQHGITVLRRLRDLKYPKRSIYHRTPLSKDRDDRTEYMGWATTGESKPLLLDAGREFLRAAAEDRIDIPSRECLRDAWSVADGELNGRDVLVSEMLAWVGRAYMVRRRVKVMEPLHY